MSDLIIDPQIRTWVFLPIVYITFVVGLLKHYLSILCRGDHEVDVDKIRDSQMLLRVQSLRRNGNYLTNSAFHARRIAFLADHEKNQFAKPQTVGNILENRSSVRESMISNILNYLPVLLIGSWLMYMLSGFLIAKIPLPLTLRFKYMFQRDIYLKGLEAQWVSSASWFFLNVGGMRSFYDMLFDSSSERETPKEQFALIYANALVQNVNGVFKNEIECLVMHQHVPLVDNLQF